MTSLRTAVRRGFLNVAVLMASLVVALVLCEIGARIVLNPANYLSVRTQHDDVLGIRVMPGSAGFDQWGFRNVQVPAQAPVVALGDSHTFGNTARLEDAWPAVVASETGLTTYNMGLGGYGPVQYFELLKTRGLSLHPKWVICGLYMGDDFENAFSITYGLDHWAYLRDRDVSGVDADIWKTQEPVVWHKRLRNWLSRTSMVYRLVVHGPVLGGVKERWQFARAERGEDPATTVLDLPDRGIKEAFRPAPIASRLDQTSPAVQDGMRLTFHLLDEMAAACRRAGCVFGVVVIPTKESVFAQYLRDGHQRHLQSAIDSVISNEALARTRLFEALDASHIPYVDTLGALRKAAAEQLYARTTNDMHPGRNGYRVIGEEVSAFLNQLRQRHEVTRVR